MTDYYCTEKARSLMETLSPEEISERIAEYNAPDGHVIVTDRFSAVYVMSVDDFQPDSRVVLYDPVFELEYFEHGIPDWLNPKSVLTYYYCSYTDGWTFEEDYRK